MREGKVELDKREMRLISNMIETTTKDVTPTFNALCQKILSKRGVEAFRPPFEVVIGCGGHATQLIYWEG